MQNDGSIKQNIESEKSLYLLGFIILALLSARVLLGEDFLCFIKWEVVTLLISVCFLPIVAKLLPGFADKGYIFSRPISIIICGYITWVLASGVFDFTTALVLIATIGLSVFIFVFGLIKSKEADYTAIDYKLIICEELVFFILFLAWTYIMGFRPEAYGTEKFMDYGFMANMMRTKSFPSVDLWYSQKTLNYYYLGQYFAVFLTKLTFTEVKQTYNLMRAFVAALSFVMSFSVTHQLLLDSKKIKRELCILGGVISGFAVSICGNMHYVIYGIIKYHLFGEDYWFPDSTRYIGYNPETNDKTIHEFPSYSFVLGDLHAHVINIIFVIAIIALIYSYIKEQRQTDDKSYTTVILSKQLILCGCMLGIFKGSNYWDFVIYFTVAIIAVFFTNYAMLNGVKAYITSLMQILLIFVISSIVIYPFTKNFESMVGGVGICEDRTPIYQLLVLWGLPVIIVLTMTVRTLMEYFSIANEAGDKKTLKAILKRVSISDYFAIILGFCAIGLIIIPEIVYVKDIYSSGFKRSNTMFKLTYQAFIMFGIVSGYAIISTLFSKCKKILKVVALMSLICHIATVGYINNSLTSFYPKLSDIKGRKGLDATVFLETEADMIGDSKAIRYLQENVDGMHVCLEANGRSYTGYGRVSAMTGLPTVLGWYVHEQLWRGNDTEDLNNKGLEVEEIYTSLDAKVVRELVDKYNIEYIFVGEREKESYEDRLNHKSILFLGEKVFEDEEYGTYIVKVTR